MIDRERREETMGGYWLASYKGETPGGKGPTATDRIDRTTEISAARAATPPPVGAVIAIMHGKRQIRSCCWGLGVRKQGPAI